LSKKGSGIPASGIPASGLSARGVDPETGRNVGRKDFEPGHLLSYRHGAFSPRFVDPIAQELTQRTLELAAEPASGIGYLLDAKYARAIHNWARAEAIADRLHEAAVRDGAFAAGGKSDTPVLRQCETWTKRAEFLRGRLGLDPMSWAKLRTELALGEQADAIALSTHGRGSVGRLLYGSVADRLAQLARVPVLLYRAPAVASVQVGGRGAAAPALR